MNYTHAGKKQPGEVGSTGSNEYIHGSAEVSGSINPRNQPTDGMNCGDATCHEAMGMVRGMAMGMTKPSGVAGGSAPSLSYTHAGVRRPSEVKS